MKIVHPQFEILDANDVMRNIETGGRLCYKSEDKICPGSDAALVEKLLNFKHESVLEHGTVTAWFLTDRGVTHELVRHRLAAFSQESTRYCNYARGKFGEEITVVCPFFFVDHHPDDCCPDEPTENYRIWRDAMGVAETQYLALIAGGASAQEARSVLPNSLKTEIQVTANVREWRHILTVRTHRDAHPQMRQLMVPFGWEMARRWPSLFGEFSSTEHPYPAVPRITTV